MLLLTAALVAIVLYTRNRNPTAGHVFPPCMFHTATGLHCPGCGGTRMMHHLLNGHISAAFRHNQLTFLLLPFILYGAVSEARRFITGKGLPYARLHPKAIWILFAVLVIYWILRNIPVYPFTLLAPP